MDTLSSLPVVQLSSEEMSEVNGGESFPLWDWLIRQTNPVGDQPIPTNQMI